jgi:Asp-tRNA(Asn)/Glu-tRNA(Gln) amidotransferase A subunit family amidase
MIAALQEAYAAHRLTPKEFVERALARLRRFVDPHWLISLDEEDVFVQAEESAERLRAGRPRSPLEGVPVAIKDQFDVRGQRTTCGTSFLRAVAGEDAEAVARLRRAGAILFGKANLYELALGPTGHNPTFGSARNPWDPERDTGGSSSGSAALVAAGVVPLALGSDLGGSLRIPAALCGVAALKPTWGRVPTGGLMHVAWSLEHAGPIAGSIDDLRLAMAVLAGERPATAALPGRLRVGISSDWWARAERSSAGVAEAAVQRLLHNGAAARAVTLPSIDTAVAVGSLTTIVEAAAAFAWAAHAPLGAAVRIPLAVGRAVPAVEFVQAQRVRGTLCRELEEAFVDVDVLVTPTTDSTARPYHGDELDDAAIARRIAFTIPFNLAGLPALQVPCGFDGEGLPVGLQIVGPRGADALVTAVAARVESQSEKREIPSTHVH